MRRSVDKDIADQATPPSPAAPAVAGLFHCWLEARNPVATPSKETPEGLRILVAADHEVTRKAFSLTLSAICDVVYMAENGAEALRALENTRFDLVFIDVHMPQMDGVETICALRDNEPAGTRTPVVAIATGVSDEDREACLLAGMDGFADTPIESRTLFALVKQVLAQAQALAQAA
jgi:two-component system sensor histidine kinase/response regulator